MKQVLQDLRSGNTYLQDVPTPQVTPNTILIKTSKSLISSGTERSLVEFGKGNYLEKARQQPDKVKQAMSKLQTDGILSTYESIKNKLDQPMTLGYSNVGTVVEVGSTVKGFTVGDRVLSNGHHSEYVLVPPNLCAKVPTDVDDETAAYTVLGSIALQGIRLADPKLGENVVVIGTGLVGLLTVQILLANGCNVIATDVDQERLKVAASYGASTVNVTEQDLVQSVLRMIPDGADAVLITASSKSNSIIAQSAQASRKRGRIVLVGVVGLDISRADFYEKELTFQVSCSYGPGRYDPDYEDTGNDYPIGFVRWTEQRNFTAVLELMKKGKLVTDQLTSHSYDFYDAQTAFDQLLSSSQQLGIILRYKNATIDRRVSLKENGDSSETTQISIGLLGPGNYAKRFILPPLYEDSGVHLHTVASSKGITAAEAGKKFGFDYASSDPHQVVSNETINTVFITTRHDTHAAFTVDALEQGKHVFVEKPLALNKRELDEVASAFRSSNQRLMVGFNRRFSPYIVRAKELCAAGGPLAVKIMVNAGHVPSTSWIQSPTEGGGRLIGECCHFVDLARFLCGSPISSSSVASIPSADGQISDTFTLSLEFESGSIANVNYFSNGHSRIPKERVEIYVNGKVIVIENFRKATFYGYGQRNRRTFVQDKGNQTCVTSFIQSLKDGAVPPIPFEQLYEVSNVCIELSESLR